MRVDELLSDGLVDEAEAYMEERRRRFVANGFHIRKLNQAYFAFHGTYADSPASVNPIGGQLGKMRSLISDLGTFVGTVSGSIRRRRKGGRFQEIRAHGLAGPFLSLGRARRPDIEIACLRHLGNSTNTPSPRTLPPRIILEARS